ncbi:MAG TPA: TonB-dependent receptor [Polyangia bacterium]|jgi:hypothetical protein
MARIRIGAAALGLALLVVGGAARAQETTGRLTGRVTDEATGAPLGGVTVIVAGPQGEDAVVTGDKGEYTFTSLPVGTYVIRFYAANTSTAVEQSGVTVAAEKMVRVNAKIAAAAAAAPQQTYLIVGKPPTVDVGSARVASQFDQTFTLNVPVGRTFGDVIERAPGAFVDGSTNVSIGGATGLENIYLINGLNVTGLRFGNLESGAATIGGGSNIPIEFLTQIDVNSGGYQAEYGGAMGGIVNTVLMSGTNEWKGSAFLYASPYWLAADPKVIIPVGSSLTGVRKPDFDDSLGVEVGGPLIKDKLFFWAGFAPRITDSHILRYTYAETEARDAAGNLTGQPVLGADGAPVVHQLGDWTAREPETHRTYFYAANLDFIPRPDNKLTLTLVGTPSFNQELKSQYGLNSLASDPRSALEELTKVNTDVNAHWTSKLMDRHWQIDAMAGMHNEYYYDRSPYADLNNLNEIQYGGTDLGTMENAPGCAVNPVTGFAPCPVNPYYQTGGFGLISKSSAYRWSGDLKSTHIFEAGGHNELKYGYHVDYNTFDLSRWYSGGSFEQAFFPNNQQGLPGGLYNTTTYFTLGPGETPVQYTTGMRPISNLQPGAPGVMTDYRYTLDTSISSLANAFFLQDSYSPNGLRNLTINAGLRLDLQRLNDLNGNSIFSTDDLAPRLSAVYDPFNDGRSKVSVSYGRYYEAIPLDVAARYFGGENFIQTFGFTSTCPAGLQNAATWAGNNESRQCSPTLGASPVFNSEYAQSNMQGQYNNEITATAEREVLEGMTVRLDYQHRWLGNIIEDGYGPGFANGVLANPGNVPQSAINTAQAQVNNAQMAVTANPMDPAAASALAAAQYNLGTLQTLKDAPPPERTYDAITLSLNQRFTKNWFARASYTYSRLIGNYEGLYQTQTNYIAPNGNNTYDAPELYVNQNGPLPNDRPHILHVDGFYSHELGRGRVTLGLSFSARSGQPRNYFGNLEPGTAYQVVMLLPRGSAGRTPTVTELNGKIAYGRALGPKMNLEGFIDLFNMFNQQTAVVTDDNYTFDAAPPIANGTASDLKFAKNTSGQRIGTNPNFGQPLAYQAPFSARLGLRLTF